MPYLRPSVTLALLAALCLPALAGAKDWQGVEPGRSACADVVTRFGEPAQRRARGAGAVLVYKDDQALPGAKSAQFICRGDGVVEEIEFFVATALDAESIEGTYGRPEVKTFDQAFNKVWQYPTLGVTVFFDKDANVKAIRFSAGAKGAKAAGAAQPGQPAQPAKGAGAPAPAAAEKAP
jgi:hypothetical protein